MQHMPSGDYGDNDESQHGANQLRLFSTEEAAVDGPEQDAQDQQCNVDDVIVVHDAAETTTDPTRSSTLLLFIMGNATNRGVN